MQEPWISRKECWVIGTQRMWEWYILVGIFTPFEARKTVGLSLMGNWGLLLSEVILLCLLLLSIRILPSIIFRPSITIYHSHTLPKHARKYSLFPLFYLLPSTELPLCSRTTFSCQKWNEHTPCSFWIGAINSVDPGDVRCWEEALIHCWDEASISRLRTSGVRESVSSELG